jgi:hypothetical protein
LYSGAWIRIKDTKDQSVRGERTSRKSQGTKIFQEVVKCALVMITQTFMASLLEAISSRDYYFFHIWL